MDAKCLEEINASKKIAEMAKEIHASAENICAENDRLKADNAAKDQQIATLKKALKLICEDCSEVCPAEWGAEHALCETYNSDDPKQRAKCQYDFYIQQAQEQEEKS